MIPKGDYQSFKSRRNEHASLYSTGYPRPTTTIPAKNRRYIACIPVKAYHNTRICLAGRVYYSQSGVLGSVIHSIDLNTDQKSVLHGHRDTVLMLTASNKYMVSVDIKFKLCIWKPSESPKPFKRLSFSVAVSAIDIDGDIFAVLHSDGTINVWDLSSGYMVASFSMAPHFVSILDLSLKVKIQIKGELIGIGMSSGHYLIFQRLKAPINHILKYEYHLIKCIFDEELHVHGTTHAPNVLELTPGFILTNGGLTEQISIHQIKVPDTKPKNIYNLNGTFDLFDQDYHQTVISKTQVLSETAAMSAFGIQPYNPGDITDGTVDTDLSMIFAVSENRTKLMVWDYRVHRIHNRYFERVTFGDIEAFVVYDDLTDANL